MTTHVRVDDWVNSYGPSGITDPDFFFKGVAQARYVIRKVTRIVDEQARSFSIDPLEHQLLIQLFGSDDGQISVNRLADRLDVPAAVASRLVKELEAGGYVLRHKSQVDRRVTEVHLTEAGRQLCLDIVDKVFVHIEFFQQQLDDEAKQVALVVFGFYVGVALDFMER